MLTLSAAGPWLELELSYTLFNPQSCSIKPLALGAMAPFKERQTLPQGRKAHVGPRLPHGSADSAQGFSVVHAEMQDQGSSQLEEQVQVVLKQ